MEVRATTGDTRLGGEDFNELLIDRMRILHRDKWDGAGRSDDPLYQRLRAAAERARRELTGQPSATLSVVWEDKVYEMTVTAETFEMDAEPLLTRLRDPVLRSMRDSGLRSEDLDEIVLVGGATRMPLVRKAATRMFGRFPAVSIDPDEAIVRGAAIQAGLKARDTALREVVLTDVCPYTLGVGIGERQPDGSIRNGLFSPIIERNTTIPASRVNSYITLQDDQKVIALDIFQGEARLICDNIALGQVKIPVPARKAGKVRVECRFTYDIDGLLEVDVTVPDTGEKRVLVISGNDDKLNALSLDPNIRAKFTDPDIPASDLTVYDTAPSVVVQPPSIDQPLPPGVVLKSPFKAQVRCLVSLTGALHGCRGVEPARSGEEAFLDHSIRYVRGAKAAPGSFKGQPVADAPIVLSTTLKPRPPARSPATARSAPGTEVDGAGPKREPGPPA